MTYANSAMAARRLAEQAHQAAQEVERLRQAEAKRDEAKMRVQILERNLRDAEEAGRRLAKQAHLAEQEVERLRNACSQPQLTVCFGSMCESNGKSNWTAILHRREDPIWKGIAILRSEYKDRVRYEADRMRWLIGELKDEPDILEYNGDLTEQVLAEPVNARLLTAARAAVAFIEGKPNAVEPFGLLRAAISAAEAQQATLGKRFALVPKRLTRAMNDLLSEEGWEWADLLAAAEAITEEEYAALVADENTEPVRLTREAVARAIWSVQREYEDRCDMELEDMGESHPVWDEADAVLAAAELAQTDTAWLTIEQARNAERYAYLRSQHEGSVAASFAVFAPEQPIGEFGPVGSMPGELDSAIDAAMRADCHKVEG